jgi:hypothetical protein
MRQFIRVQSIAFREPWHMHVVFTNGEDRDIDLTPYIADGPIFAPVRTDQDFFYAAQIEGGTIAWPNGADIDPDVLYYGGPPPWATEHVTTLHDEPE